MKIGNIKEKYNERLERWAVKFHGMKKGAIVNVKGWGTGTVVDYNFKFPNEYIDVNVESRGFNSQYSPHNVTMVSNL